MSKPLGTKRIFVWQSADSSTASPSREIHDGVKKVLESMNMNSVPRERWRVTVNIFRHIGKEGHNGQGKELWITSTPSMPSKKFLCLRNEKLIMESDDKAFAVLNKTQLYKHRLSTVIDGPSYSLGDFSARLGQATMHHNNKPIGMVLEVEYHPVNNVATGSSMLTHFVRILQSGTTSLGGHFSSIEAPYADYNLGAEYSHLHNTLQYIQLTLVLLQGRNMRASGAPMGAVATPGSVPPSGVTPAVPLTGA